MTTDQELREVGMKAAAYAIRHCGSDKATLRDLLYALDVLPDPDVARRHAHQTIVNSRPPLTEVRDQVLDEFLADHPIEEIAANVGRSVSVVKRLISITQSQTVRSSYIADPDERLAWMLTNAPEYVAPARERREARDAA